MRHGLCVLWWWCVGKAGEAGSATRAGTRQTWAGRARVCTHCCKGGKICTIQSTPPTHTHTDPPPHTHTLSFLLPILYFLRSRYPPSDALNTHQYTSPSSSLLLSSFSSPPSLPIAKHSNNNDIQTSAPSMPFPPPACRVMLTMAPPSDLFFSDHPCPLGACL